MSDRPAGVDSVLSANPEAPPTRPHSILATDYLHANPGHSPSDAESGCLAESQTPSKGIQEPAVAAAKPTPSGICPAAGGDQAAGFRSAESCFAS